MSDPIPSEPAIVQIALAATDMPASVRFYTEGLGFENAGATTVWGPAMRAQKLDDDARATVWFLVGRQRFVQLELFTHTAPVPRPLAADWRPSDHGWTRFGVAVPDFDATLARLSQQGVAALTDPVVRDGLRRVCVRDPGTAVVVELLEDGPSIPGGVRPSAFELGPAVVYATVSVGDLDLARDLFVDSLGLVEDPRLDLHVPEMEALWGLPGATSESFVVRGDDVYVEVVRYDDPVGRPPPPDHRMSDQGFLNISLGVRTQQEFDAIVERATARGHELNAPAMAVPLLPSRPDLIFCGCYLTGRQGESVEVEAVPPELERVTFFHPIRVAGPDS